MKNINSQTKILGIFGCPVSHSLSPLIHNKWAQDYKLNYVYTAFNIEPQNLKKAIESIRVLNIAGINITVPHKINSMKFVDYIDKSAKKIGSINTIVNKNNKLFGYNTDYEGFIKDLEKNKINLKNKNILVIGAGGAAKAILYALNELKVKKIFLTSRTISKAKSLSKKYKNINTIDTKEINTNFLENIDCLINCSTCGMKKDDILPFKINTYNKNIVFYDIIYNKLTPFKKFALKNKIKYFSGEGMLIYQAAVSFYRWTNIFPETKNIFQLLKKNME